MRKILCRFNMVVVFLALATILLSGCASSDMKGTPYYTTEPDSSPRAAKERIPLWPIIYYRSPTLSVLWPFFEKSDEFMTLRPLASVYGLGQEKKIYSLLWPLGEFNRGEKENRFFPMFWGDQYCVGLPLYWHFDHPLGPDGGLDALIPLWWYSSDKRGYSFNLLWPLVNFTNKGEERGWRAWPLLGAYWHGADSYYRFAAWPLAHQWKRGTAEKGDTVLPLYFRHTTPDGRLFLSLPYSRHRSPDRQWDLVLPLLFNSRDAKGSKTITPIYSQGGTKDQNKAWQLLLPLYYSSRDYDQRTVITLLGGLSKDAKGLGWVALPLLAGGSKSKDSSSTWLGGPLAHFGHGPGRASSHIFPLYYSSTNQSGHTFVSLPWSSGSTVNGRSWQLIPPLMLRKTDGRDHLLLTPLYASGTSHAGLDFWQTLIPLWYRSVSPEEKTMATLLGGWQTDETGRNWLIWPLLSGGRQSKNARDYWIMAPLFHARLDKAGLSSHLFPLYWWNAHDKILLSPLYSKWGDPETKGETKLVPPALTLYTSTPERKDLWTVAGAAHFSWGEKPGSSHVLPLYYRDREEGTFLSIPWSRWTWDDTTTNTLIAPALSWMTRQKNRSDLWLAGPMAHFSWGRKAGASHILPLYYRDPAEGTFLSIPWSTWTWDDTTTNTLIAPALSWIMRQEDRSDLWLAGPMAHFSWGKKAGSSHVLPLYYRDKAEGTFLSIPWSTWTWNNTSTNTLIAPALSWMTRREDRSDLWAIGPMAHFSWGKKAGASHVLPLFYRNKQTDTFISLPYAHWQDGQEEHDLYPPLLSMYSRNGNEKRLDALLGLFSERWGDDRHEGYCLPLYYHDNWDKFYTLLFGWNRDEKAGFYYPLTPLVGVRTGQHSGGWLFPLWSRDHDKKAGQTTGTFLWGSYRSDGNRTESSLIPLFGYNNRGPVPETFPTNSWGGRYGKTFWSLPAIWYRNTVDISQRFDKHGKQSGKMQKSSVRDHGCFPLWTYTHQITKFGGDETFGSLLLCLYNYKSITKTNEVEVASGTSSTEQVRKQVLWRFYHYERNNKDVSVDIFPAITYDRTEDGFKRWAFLWRAFRYERGPEGKKLDILFIPLVR